MSTLVLDMLLILKSVSEWVVMLGRKSRFWNRWMTRHYFGICHACIIIIIVHMEYGGIPIIILHLFYSKYRVEMKTRRRRGGKTMLQEKNRTDKTEKNYCCGCCCIKCNTSDTSPFLLFPLLGSLKEAPPLYMVPSFHDPATCCC